MDESKIMLSIIIPVYNSEKTIKRCIKSILNIEDLSYEIIIVDDGSKDNSYALAQRLLSGREHSIILKQKNQGPSAARNTGIINSKGEYIMFVDSDDWIESSEIGKIAEVIKTDDYDTIMYNSNSIDGYGSIIEKKRFDTITHIEEQKILFKVLVTSYEINCVWNNLYSSKIIKANKIWFDENTRNGEDLLFNIKYFEKAKKNKYIDSKIYNHSIDSCGITNTFFMWKFDDVSKTYFERMRILKKYLNNDLACLSVINRMYSKVLFRYIALAKKNKIKNSEITKKINDCNLQAIFEHDKEDSFFENITKFLIRNRMYNRIKILYEIYKKKCEQ